MRSLFRKRASAAIAGAVALVLGGSIAAWAAGPGVGDVTDAMRYNGTTSPIGTILTDLSGDDDETTTVAAPFTINFFGTAYAGICVTTNGGIYPVLTPGDGCQNYYDKNLASLALASTAPMIAPLAADLDLGNCDDNSDDGFGVACEIYFGTTTVDGRDAFVVTWYRVPMYEDDNDPALSSTFQVVIVKRATGSDVAGWDFDIEFNYGTLTDIEDGYDTAAPTGECESNTAVEDCRWGVGWANYDSVGGTADPYELFASTPITNLADGGANALTGNSLNSTVAGRYTFSMVGGVTVGFAVPVLDGSLGAAAEGPELAATGGFNWRLLVVAATLVAMGAVLVAAPRRRIA